MTESVMRLGFGLICFLLAGNLIMLHSINSLLERILKELHNKR